MSVFNDDGTPANFLEALVGDGKKFSDPESLARGKWEADKTIEQRNQELEAERASSDALKAELALLKLSQTPTTPKTEPRSEDNQPAKPSAPSPEDFAKLVREQIAASKQDEAIAANVNRVSQKLVELYGDEDKANQIVRAKATELGVSMEFLQEVAAKSPKAFFSQLGIEDKQVAPNSPTRSDVNPAAFNSNSATNLKPGTYKFYEQLRKDDPKTWEKIQPQIHAEALAKGSAFFE